MRLPSARFASPCRVLWLLAAAGLTCAAARAQAPAATGPYRISGRVTNAETGAPLAGAEVAIIAVPAAPTLDTEEPQPPREGPRVRRGGPPPPTALASVTTGEDGSFLFAQLPAAKYRLTGTRRGFLESSYEGHGQFSSAIVTGEGLVSEGLNLRISPGGIIFGSVTDGASDPVEAASVSLYRRADDGLGRIHLFRSVNTDDLGRYEFAHLPEGTYFVTATGRVWYASGAGASLGAPSLVASSQNLDLLFPRVFFPGTTDFHTAAGLAIRGGERAQADLHLLAEPAIHLIVPVETREEGSEEEDHGTYMPEVTPAAVFDDQAPPPGFSEGGVNISRLNGRQTASISVVPGAYDVEMNGSTLHVNASGGDAQLHPEAGIPSVDVTGKLGAVAGASLYDPLLVTLVPVGGEGGRAAGTGVGHDGSFTVQGIQPGEYLVRVNGRGRSMSVIQMEATGAKVSGLTLTVGTAPVSLAALVAPASSVVMGMAEEQGKPVAGMMIVLVPEDAADTLLFRRDQTDSDGSFVLRDVAPGRYTVVAIRDAWEIDWAKPSVIGRYLRAGVPVTISDGNGKMVHLAKPVAVQPR